MKTGTVTSRHKRFTVAFMASQATATRSLLTLLVFVARSEFSSSAWDWLGVRPVEFPSSFFPPSSPPTFIRYPLKLRGAGACLPVTTWRKALVDRGGEEIAPLNAELLRAASLGNEQVVRRLIEAGAEVNCTNTQLQTPLLLASEKGRLGVLLALLEFGASQEDSDEKGSNALHYAAYNGHLDAMKALVEAGIDVDACNRFGYSPLQYACAEGSIMSVELLLSLGADVHSHDKMGWTALHRAAGNGHVGVVRALIRNGADVNHRDLQKYTALHEATWCGHAEIASILLAAGARIEQTDQWGNSALDLAFSRARDGKDDMYLVLQRFIQQGATDDTCPRMTSGAVQLNSSSFSQDYCPEKALESRQPADRQLQKQDQVVASGREPAEQIGEQPPGSWRNVTDKERMTSSLESESDPGGVGVAKRQRDTRDGDEVRLMVETSVSPLNFIL